MKPRAWICWSCGKDSAWALHVVRCRGELEVAGLLTTVTEAYGRVSMHAVREEILQAAAAALPLACTVDGPMFNRPIPVRVGESVERDGFVFCDLTLVDQFSC